MARSHDEEDDTEGEQVDDLALVGLLGDDFGSHVAGSADLGTVDTGAIAALKRASKAEVDDLDVVVLVEEDVLGLEIAMGEAARVDVVDALEQLLEVELADLLSEGTGVGDVVEELATSDHLLDDIGNVLALATSLLQGGLLLKVVVAHDIVVVELRGGLNLLAEQLEGSLVEVGVGEVEDLKGEFLAVLSLPDLDFSREAGAERPAKGESVESGTHCFVLDCDEV
mmetsp:Transcript_18364/g.21664  ORF Transcript_18364/g.21664 Transcript_18364/m.21664 type:complete len:226 (-) Transcript_18364:25-702(-)